MVFSMARNSWCEVHNLSRLHSEVQGAFFRPLLKWQLEDPRRGVTNWKIGRSPTENRKVSLVSSLSRQRCPINRITVSLSRAFRFNSQEFRLFISCATKSNTHLNPINIPWKIPLKSNIKDIPQKKQEVSWMIRVALAI